MNKQQHNHRLIMLLLEEEIKVSIKPLPPGGEGLKFSKIYRRYYDLISKFQVGLKSLLRQGLSEPDFYGDLVYKLKKIVGSYNFSAQFIKIISHYKKIGYNINVLQQTATQSRLATLLSSLIARRWVRLQTL